MTEESKCGYRDFLFYCHILYPRHVAPLGWQTSTRQAIVAVFELHGLAQYITFAGMSENVATYVAKRANFFCVNFRLTEPVYWQYFHPQTQGQFISDLAKLDVTAYYFGREGDEWLHLNGEDAKQWTLPKQE